MTRIAVDPITRIEGHLRIEIEVEDGQITDAWSSATQFRGMEIVLKGRDPRDAWLFAQRICGVCTTVHALASVRAVEDALGLRIPPNAHLIRNLIAGAQYIQDHVVHFYQLHALDWVDPSAALQADPNKASQLAASISEQPSSASSLKGVQSRVKSLVDSGQLSLFTNAYFGHPAYELSPEANLLLLAHYLDALTWQREIIRMQALLGGKNPHPQSYLVGGMAMPVDPNRQDALNADGLARIRQWIGQMQDFVEHTYWPDLLLAGKSYPDWFKWGGTRGNYMSYGDFAPQPYTLEDALFPAGLILDGDLSQVHEIDQSKITEEVTHAWYDYSGGDRLHPWEGETRPNYTGPEPPYDFLNTDAEYSWLKSPRYEGHPVEVGPLARVLIAYAKGDERVTRIVDPVLGELGAGPEVLHSTIGRTLARAVETRQMANEMPRWADMLVANMSNNDLRIRDDSRWDPSTWPRQAQGYGFHEAPRGSLGHWINIEDGAIANYQAVVPSTWNAGPRDAQGQLGPYEQSLVGTPIADPEKPVEVLRTIHSFDPCLACAAHVVDAQGREIAQVKVM